MRVYAKNIVVIKCNILIKMITYNNIWDNNHQAQKYEPKGKNKYVYLHLSQLMRIED